MKIIRLQKLYQKLKKGKEKLIQEKQILEKLIQEDHINRTNQKRKKKSKRMIPNLKKEIKIKQKKTKLKKKKKKILLASIDGNSEDPKVKKLQVKL